MGVWASQVVAPLLISITYKNGSNFIGENKKLSHAHVKPIMVVFKNGKLTILAVFFGLGTYIQYLL